MVQTRVLVRLGVTLILALAATSCGGGDEAVRTVTVTTGDSASETPPTENAETEDTSDDSGIDYGAYRESCINIYVLTGGDWSLATELDEAAKEDCQYVVQQAKDACGLALAYESDEACWADWADDMRLENE